jgi:hypothetical protein
LPCPAAGALVIQDGKRQVALPAVELARLPRRTLTVTFVAGTASQTDTETGPTLAAVLAAARIIPGLNTWVAAVGDDGTSRPRSAGRRAVTRLRSEQLRH